MKTINFKKMAAVIAVSGLTWSASTVLAQDSTASPQSTVAVNTPAPRLSNGAEQILHLTQAKISDDTIIAYIKNSGNNYNLDASQIIYLKQQGVSETVIATMLNQPKTAAATPATAASPPTISTATVAPTVTYVQTVPTTTYYYQPYYYPAYAWYPPVVFSFGWGGGWHGGGWHGGWHH